MDVKYQEGSYGYDKDFLQKHEIPFVELKEEKSGAALLLVPGYQGRVMTSTASGNEGASFGWINHALIASGNTSEQFNPYGGEERLWLGPEGGPFSIYFPPGALQDFSNWKVPGLIDTAAFVLVEQSGHHAVFSKEASLTNASGTPLSLRIDRTVRILDRENAAKALRSNIGGDLAMVAYESENVLTNTGSAAWDESSGLLSIWMLSMFNPSDKGVVFIPFKKGSEDTLGPVVNDDYFGKVPSDRLKISDGMIYFKTDGKRRGKIGLSPQRALPWCGSYDPVQKALTLLWYLLPGNVAEYVNAKWGPQEDPLDGDVVNAYNDGPLEDGSIMGPFYELESSSPAAFLAPSESMVHRQMIFHIAGEEEELDLILQTLFGITIDEVKNVFDI
ncbi:MAG: DUF6786 family protein [Bacteroidales bacterium]|nr:DUF6786 family protein [Bacteroidales bacterium]